MIELGQAIIDIFTWLLTPFAVMLAVSWALSFFRRG